MYPERIKRPVNLRLTIALKSEAAKVTSDRVLSKRQSSLQLEEEETAERSRAAEAHGGAMD